MSKRSIVLHLDEPWYNALSSQLKKEDMTVEDKLDEYLDDLLNQLPERVYKKVSQEVWEEHQAAANHQDSTSPASQEGGAVQESGKVVRVSDILPLLPEGGRSFLCHRDAETAVLAENLRQLTDAGQEDFSALLNAEVSEIVPTPEGTEVMLTGVEPEELVRFNEAFDEYQEAEQTMWSM